MTTATAAAMNARLLAIASLLRILSRGWRQSRRSDDLRRVPRAEEGVQGKACGVQFTHEHVI